MTLWDVVLIRVKWYMHTRGTLLSKYFTHSNFQIFYPLKLMQATCRIGLSDLREKQNGHLLPNCFRTPIPKFNFLLLLFNLAQGLREYCLQYVLLYYSRATIFFNSLKEKIKRNLKTISFFHFWHRCRALCGTMLIIVDQSWPLQYIKYSGRIKYNALFQNIQ